MPSYRRSITIDGERKLYSHYVWFQNTDHWPISPDEVVHHIDGDTLNDEFSNLQLMSESEHLILHATGRTHTEETKAKMSAKAKLRVGKKNNRWIGDAATPKAIRSRIRRTRMRADEL